MLKPFIALLMAVAVCGCQSAAPRLSATHAKLAETTDRSNEDTEFKHVQSSMYFPKSVAGFERGKIDRFNPSGSDMRVSYWLRGQEWTNYVSVYIYPAAAQWRPGADEDATYDALEKKMMCGQEFRFREQELTKMHPDTALGEAKRITVEQNGASHEGVRLSFYSIEKFGGTPQTTKEEFDLFCFATELWTIAYRFSNTDYAGAAEDISRFMQELRWPQ